MADPWEIDPTTENETPWENHGIDHDDDDDKEVDTTQTFTPGAASTPYQLQGATAGSYHGGESHEMTDFGPEESGISDTPLCWHRSNESGHGRQLHHYILMLVQQILKHTMIHNRKDPWLKRLVLAKKHTIFIQRTRKINA